jgi:pimeloyl-ACP methyl ester carboxylesterase
MEVGRRFVNRLLVFVAGVVVLAAVLALLNGDARPSAEDSTANGSGRAGPAGVVPAGLDAFYGQRLDWAGCGPLAETDAIGRAMDERGFRCSRMLVPLDYGDPDGPTLRIAVARLVTASPERRIGSLVFNPGGPGVSGLSAVAFDDEHRGSELGSRFDLVTFDPRGTGGSDPVVRCLSDAELDTLRADENPDASAAAYVAACVRRVGTHVLAHVGTADVARDLDVLRSAMGDELLTYHGASYGSRLATGYAALFPTKVRAMLLDGAVDPHATLDARTLEQAQGFLAMFDRFARRCTMRRTCPLGTDRARAADRLVTLLDRIAWPVRVDGRALSRADAVLAIRQGLYGTHLWDRLTADIAGLSRGAGRDLLMLADGHYGRADDGYGRGFDITNAVQCLDYPRLSDHAYERRLAVDGGLFDVGPLRRALRYCQRWPVPPTGSVGRLGPGTGLAPVLVLAARGDPATSHREGVALADALGGWLLTVEDDRHGTFLAGNGCVNEAGVRYLITLAPPPTATCPR